ncbi:hypothetical protein AB6F11_13370 [Vibrio sp. 10N.247.311.14]|uniref:hypothetical protein n=2 Tax=Vibrionaceae TaxID=641 RepID=UPI00030C80A8|nr:MULTISPECIES: hypothetical protein [Vibrio]MCC4879668.1 hypothetical protein [Vibrio splendidus]OCH53399.1 hypothetical protein A6D97_12830 [Vibrio sp. ZF57]OEE92344.1 hypothetical protein A140_01495 [Vibrio crassostreae 9ZC88]PMK28621.1 hypothetical protein BCU05_02920 [Vibrio sp. 10N.261.54.C3]PMO01308.1 hypothetical protein BCT21_08415 [Vibrio sp. 10N.222.55.F9]
MKKTLIAISCTAIIGGGALVANNMLIKNAAETVTSEVESSLIGLKNQFIDAQLIDTEINNNNIKQNFAIYINNGSKRLPEPIYLSHTATVAPFGLSVEGNFSLPKDKGLTSTLIREVASLNESIKYTFDTSNQSLDLQSNFSLGEINTGRSSNFKLGDVEILFKGNKEAFTTSTKIDGIRISERREQAYINGIELKSNITNDTHNTEIIANDGGFNDRSGGFSFKDAKFHSAITIEDNTSLKLDWKVDSLDLQSPNITQLSNKLGLSGEIKGVNTQELNSFIGLIERNPTEETIEAAFKSIIGNGIKFENINIFVNDSSSDGEIEIMPKNYKGLTNRESEEAFEKSLKVDFNVTITPKLVKLLEINQNALDRLWNEEESGNYTTTIKQSLGKTFINGVEAN